MVGPPPPPHSPLSVMGVVLRVRCQNISFYQYLLCQETSDLRKKNTDETSESSTRSMEDILEENAALKYQNQWLIDVITKNISDLSNRIDTNTEEVSSVR